MKGYVGIDLGSTTTKAVILDDQGEVIGRGITNSRSNYDLAAGIARDEARINARFGLLERRLKADPVIGDEATRICKALNTRFRMAQQDVQLERLHEVTLRETEAERVKAIAKPLRSAVDGILGEMVRKAKAPSIEEMLAAKKTSDFFRDRAAADYSKGAEAIANRTVSFEALMGIFDKAIIQVENMPMDLSFSSHIEAVMASMGTRLSPEIADRCRWAVKGAAAEPFDEVRVIGTGYGRQRLPFAKEDIRSEILCHGLGAHRQFPNTRTVLDIGGQDTKAIQIDDRGIVTSFQMNDRCAAGCGRYLGYIADEMSVGVHELGPMALKSTRRVKISSTCTVFAGAELRDRLSAGEKREDILAGLHRAIILRAMALLARSGGVHDEFTFTGGVANNGAAVKALTQLVEENYGERVLNISPGSIYTGALGAAIFCLRGEGAMEAAS